MRNQLVLALLAVAAVAPAPLAAQSVHIEEFPVAWEGRPRDPYVGPEGRVWFVGQAGNYIGQFDPATEQFKRYEIDEGTHPHNLIVDTDGMVWYAGNRNAMIGKLDPATGEITRYPMPDPAARDPHTLVFDDAGHIWFTVQGGNFIGRLDKATGRIELVSSKTPESRPYGIKLDSQGRPWINLFGTNKLATIDPETMALREIELPRPDARSRRISITSDDMIWYVDYAGGFLGRYDPSTEEFQEWPAPSGAQSQPYAMGQDAEGRIWFVETGVDPNQFVGFDPETEEFFSVSKIPSGGGAVRHMMFHEPTHTFWFGTDTNNLARAMIH
ncbi:MAG: virginiamycin B lyase family protein [Longimicrobiales bacterium]